MAASRARTVMLLLACGNLGHVPGAISPDSGLDERLAALDALLAPLPGVLVAFSGGVASGMLLAAAVRALGAGRVVAATAVSPSLPASERAGAAAFAASLGVRHEQ